MILKTKNNFSPDQAFWVIIVDNHEEVKLNHLIRWPIKSVNKMGMEFYGISKDDMRCGESLNYIHFTVYKLCEEADAIIAVSPEGYFDSLCYLAIYYNVIRHKILDLGRILSPRNDGNPITQKLLELRSTTNRHPNWNTFISQRLSRNLVSFSFSPELYHEKI